MLGQAGGLPAAAKMAWTCCLQHLCQSPQKPGWLLLFTGMFRTGFTREHPFWGREHLPSSTTPCRIPPCLAAAAGAVKLILPSHSPPSSALYWSRTGRLLILTGIQLHLHCRDVHRTDTDMVLLLPWPPRPADARVLESLLL